MKSKTEQRIEATIERGTKKVFPFIRMAALLTFGLIGVRLAAPDRISWPLALSPATAVGCFFYAVDLAFMAVGSVVLFVVRVTKI